MRGPAEMRLQHLADIHARRYAQRIQADIDRRAVLHVRHVFDRHDFGNHAFVAVPPGHFVAGLQVSLDRDEHLDDFQHARRQVVAFLDFIFLLGQTLVELLLLRFHLVADALDDAVGFVVAQANLKPLFARQVGKISRAHAPAGLQTLRSAVDGGADQQLLDARIRIRPHDALLVVHVLLHHLQLGRVVGFGARVLLQALTGEHLHIDDGAFHAGRQAQRSVFYIGRFLAEDGAQQFLFRGELGLALRRDFADQHIARLDLRADINDAGFVQLRQRAFPDIGDVAADFLAAEFGVARDARQLLDVNRSVDIVLDQALGDENRILEVVTVPRHKRDEHIAPQRQLAQVGGRPVGQYIAARHDIADLRQRPLVDGGVLVGALVFGQVVDVHARLVVDAFVVVDSDHDARSVHRVDHAAAPRHHRDPGVDGDDALHAGADQRLLGANQRHRLTLHVGAHQRAVGVVVLEERHHRSRHRDDLLRRDIDIVDLLRRRYRELVLIAARNQVVGEPPFGVERGVGLRDDEFVLLDGRQKIHPVGHHAVLDLAVRRLQKSAFIGARKTRQRVNQTDVRALRRLDRTNPAVVGRMHIAHFEAGALAR